jgi:hypothetical protein
MDTIVSLLLAILLGAFVSSVAFEFIARGLGFKYSETLNPVYRTAADFLVRDNQSSGSSGLKVQTPNSQLVYHSYDPSSSQYYSILPKGDSARSTNFQHQLKTRKNGASRRRYLVPVNEPLKED